MMEAPQLRRSQILSLETEYVYSAYDNIAPHLCQTKHKAWPRVVKFLEELPPGAMVADVGSGTGRYLNINMSTYTLGSDRCYRFVQAATHKVHGPRDVMVCDNLHLPYRPGIFDAVISIGVLHHLSSVERRGEAVSQLSGLLTRGGRLMIYVWAMEQKKRKFDSQDVLIPWSMQTRHIRKKAPQLIQKGKIDFLVSEYLSEITMSLLTAVKHKMPNFGYTPDFIQAVMAPFLRDIKQQGIRVISNAGGVNPHACAAALQALCKENAIQMNVAVMTGDDLMEKLPELDRAKVEDMYNGLPLPKTIHSMNAYLGAGPIARALDLGADVVITGRCADSALALAPLLHTFGWKPDDYDLLAAGSLAGHLIECGAQATGGIFTDWDQVPDWHKIGFPIVECARDGNFILTKPPKTGGLINRLTVSEQLVYEIGDPTCYALPDVMCDFSQATVTEIEHGGGPAVYVSGAKGHSASEFYKVCSTYADGYRSTAVCCVGGPRAAEKARKTTDAILLRTRRIFSQLGLEDYTRTHTQVIGSEETYGPHANVHPTREAAVWLAVQHKQKKALELFAREIAPAGTGMAPGLTNIVGGRPKVSPVLRLFSFLYPKENIKVELHMNGDMVEEYVLQPPAKPYKEAKPANNDDKAQKLPSGTHSYRVEDLACTRSGDKGNNVNIGVVARDPSYLPYLKQALTVEAVAEYFHHLFEDDLPAQKRVARFELPGIHGLNFVLRDALGGGGVASLRTDPQGKAVAQMLLDFIVDNVPELVKKEES